MRILFLDAYFEPEQIAFTHLENDLLEKLSNEGNQIDVICPVPTRGVSVEIAKAYKQRKTDELYGGHVQVKRFSAPQEGKNPLIRAARYLWCNLRTYQLGKKGKECDLVFCNSTPPTQGWIAGKVAHKLKIPFVYSLQDVFPDSLVTTGLTRKGSFLWNLGRKLEEKTYSYCDAIIVITEAMRQNLLEKGVHEDKIHLISNWIDTDRTKPISRTDNRLFDEFSIDRSKFIVLYAGNFGEAQGAEIILDAAERLQDHDDIQFIIFGGGTGYEEACRKADNLDNVFIHPLMPQSRVSEVYSMGDVAIVSARRGVGRSGMPSKTWSIMACNTTVIASYDPDSELCGIINKYNAGICVEPENVNEIVKAILAVQQDKNTPLSNQSRAAVKEIASKEGCTLQYLETFRQTMGKRKGKE